MNGEVSIRRTRGAVCGVALILLGVWGGLAPFIGPYVHFGYTPDKAWAYTSGRLYFSAVPGGVALVGGLAVLVTRSRALGVIGGTLAAIAGAWFVIGSGVTYYLLKYTSITTGSPLGTSTGGTYTVRMYLEVLALYGAVGALIIFFGALACGRLSMVTARDVAAAEADGTYYSDYPASAATPAAPAAPAPDFPATTGPFPATTEYSGPSTGPFPTTAGQFPGGSGQFGRPSSFRRTPEEYPGQSGSLPDPPTQPT
jgi:hypothetical protein